MIYLEIDILVRSPTPSHTGGRSVVVGGKGGAVWSHLIRSLAGYGKVPDGKERKVGHQAFYPRRVLSLSTRIRKRIAGDPTHLSEIDQEFEEKII